MSCIIHIAIRSWKYFVGVVDLIIRILIGQDVEYLRCVNNALLEQ